MHITYKGETYITNIILRDFRGGGNHTLDSVFFFSSGFVWGTAC